MADITITSANVIAGKGSQIESGIAGGAVTAGQVVYLDNVAKTYKLADNDVTGSVAAYGITLNGAATGQPLAVLKKGPLTIGAAITAGSAYYLSSTAGGICPVADVDTGDTPVLLGLATSTTVLNVNIQNSGVTLA